ncbi:uncharacterized protein LOC133909227 isoform X2 [Phragmites australis]|uniref:uncharacterized protein LOC133909227 isoform X2 n=1 Tax=Phragmites australis TaxID=29695 RepID=UPI002D77AA51|nr:uncharacterized protein LOC133909227 isoform X2 [Phragmites australis]
MLLTRLPSSSCSSTALQRHACTGKAPFRGAGCCKKREKLPGLRARVAVKLPCAAPGKGGIVPAGNEDGVSLGTVKLPGNIDIARFETLLFQVDKVEGGIRLGFIAVEDGVTQTMVYIDCVVSPATDGSGPVFRAIRNGPMKDKEPPGEPRIMRSLLQAIQKSIQIARV